MLKLPIEKLDEIWPRSLYGAKIGAVLHPASVDRNLCHTLDILTQHPNAHWRLAALFGPQHGFVGNTQDNMIEWQSGNHPKHGVPIYSLYSENREPTPQMLSGLDALLVDLQDVGARYYTFIWTMYLCAKACEKARIPLVVCDRPNPLANTVEGPILNPNYRSFVGLHPIPVRHGKTIGELARQFKAEAFPSLDLIVLEMEGHRPDMWWDETGLPWVLPSPNMPTLDTAIVYPGQCLLEATNVSEGRGTTKPFEIFGAPWIDAEAFKSRLDREHLPAVHFREVSFEPTFHKFSKQLCHGVQIHVLDRHEFLPFRTSMSILNTMLDMYPQEFAWKPPPYEYEMIKLPIEILLGGPLKQFFPQLSLG